MNSDTGKKWNKRILCVLMQWDYCDEKRGVSGDKLFFYDNLAKLTSGIEAFWYDGYINDLPRLRAAVLEKAEQFKPDLVFFVPYTDQLDQATLDRLKQKWPTCAWFGDDTWRFESYSSKLAPHFTHVCTTDPFSVSKYRQIGVEPVLTQWAAQASGPMPVDISQAAYKYDVTFVGGYNEARDWMLKFLRKRGIKVECFGAGWPAGRVSFEEMENVFRSSRINLNLSNSISHDIRFVFGSPRNALRYLRAVKVREQIKARNFEIPLAGGFQLTNYVAGLERYLRIGEEVSVFASPEECLQQIKYYLAHEDERKTIMLAGHARAAKEHTYMARLTEVLKKIWP